MAGTILGIDIGYDSLKLALCRNGEIKKTAAAEMPDNLFQDGRIASPETMGELIRATMRKNRIHAFNAAMVLPNELCYMRTVTMPVMTADQLKLNIPYEFTDYLEDEPKNYVFDYAMISNPREEPEAENMELMAVAAPGYVLSESRRMLDVANLRLVKAAPSEYVHIPIIRFLERNRQPHEYCILDLGCRSVRMYMYRGDRHMVTRVLETGLRSVDEAVSAALNVDIFLARKFLTTNYEGCQEKEFSVAAYNGIAIELMRALNFYRFSNPDSSLEGIWLCGGGAGNATLRRTIAETLGMEIHSAGELLPGKAEGEESYRFLQAVGVTMD